MPIENLLELNETAPSQKTGDHTCIYELEKTLNSLSEEDASHLLYIAKRLADFKSVKK